MRNMLAIWRAHGLDAILRECVARGVVLAGLSAGAMCWFEGGITKSAARPSRSRASGCSPARCRALRRRARAPAGVPRGGRVRRGPGVSAADDGVGLLFRDGRLERVVSSRPAAGCVRVKRAGDRAVEQPVHVDLLADREPLVAVDPDVRELRATRYRSLRGGV
jgi:hypothetical protein